MRKILVFALAFAPPLLLIAACSGIRASDGEDAGMGAGDAAVADRTRLKDPIVVDAACRIVIDTPELMAVSHVPSGTIVNYNSNPPSSGPHYAVWAAYKTYSAPIDRRNYVHNLEHGAIVFAYKCAKADGCPDVVAAFEKAAAELPTDSLCATTGVRVRVLITPDPLLDVPIAAAAWGWTYKAECLDPASLAKFAYDHYGQGTERTCSNGQAF